ncbi:MAG: alpha/beta hydrolase [Chloroflexi bacterium]|nr:alpha/beta hydrolase [Chloroflexota bacterium]
MRHKVAPGKNPSILGMKYENISFKSTVDNLTLHGWFIPSVDSNTVIVMLHAAYGHRADSSIGLLNIAAGLVNNGYNVLTFDLRGHGDSEGHIISGGYYEKRDLFGALIYLQQRGFHKIGVIGFSLGAATTLLTAAETQDISAIVSDSCFADLNVIIGSEITKRTRLPGFVARPLVYLAKKYYHVDFRSIKPEKEVSKIYPRPILFIHGANDNRVPLNEAYRLLKASNNPLNQLWIAPDSPHIRSYINNPEEYMSRITVFFNSSFSKH